MLTWGGPERRLSAGAGWSWGAALTRPETPARPSHREQQPHREFNQHPRKKGSSGVRGRLGSEEEADHPQQNSLPTDQGWALRVQLCLPPKSTESVLSSRVQYREENP